MSRVRLEDVAIEHKESLKKYKNGLPIVGLEHLTPMQIKLTKYDVNVETTFTKMFRKGNVLFGRRRAYLKKAVFAEFDGICSGDIIVIEALPGKIVPELLPFIIQNDNLFEYAVAQSAGSLSPRVKWEQLKKFEFELPEMEKQKQLADLLWSIEDSKESYKNLINITDELVKSQFISEMDIWKRTGTGIEYKLGELTKIKTGKLDANASSISGIYPFFTCSKEILKISSYSYDCECVLVSGNGELNVKYYNGKFDAYQRTYIVESKDKNKVIVPFLYRFLEQYVIVLKEQAIGGIIKYIKMENLNDASIIVPSISEQNRFIQFAEQSDKSKIIHQKLFYANKTEVNIYA